MASSPRNIRDAGILLLYTTNHRQKRKERAMRGGFERQQVPRNRRAMLMHSPRFHETTEGETHLNFQKIKRDMRACARQPALCTTELYNRSL